MLQQTAQQQAETTAASTVRRPPPQTLLKAPIKPLLFYGREGSRGRREGKRESDRGAAGRNQRDSENELDINGKLSVVFATQGEEINKRQGSRT